MKVSVLVAVYNAEKHLSVCLDSLINQTHENIQIICIDDASTDSSWTILQEYAAKDERIVLLRQSVNRGQAEARNRGLQLADGEVVTMLDSDDWFSLDALEKGCRMMEEDLTLDCVLYDLCYHEISLAFVTQRFVTNGGRFSVFQYLDLNSLGMHLVCLGC